MLAQWLARSLTMREVPGSSPARSEIKRALLSCYQPLPVCYCRRVHNGKTHRPSYKGRKAGGTVE